MMDPVLLIAIAPLAFATVFFGRPDFLQSRTLACIYGFGIIAILIEWFVLT